MVKWQFDHKPHPEQGYRTCLGLLSLAKRYGPSMVFVSHNLGLILETCDRITAMY